MKLFNNTSNEVYFGISAPGVGDCGNIAAGDTADWPQYDNMQDVNVTFAAMPNPPSPFDLTINDTGTGKAVTIGLYLQ